jgi:hypothetical protein
MTSRKTNTARERDDDIITAKEYRFFYHFNKPATKSEGRVVWTIHWRDRCMQAYNLDIRRPTKTRGQTKRQPWGVVVGMASSVVIDNDGNAVIA